MDTNDIIIIKFIVCNILLPVVHVRRELKPHLLLSNYIDLALSLTELLATLNRECCSVSLTEVTYARN